MLKHYASAAFFLAILLLASGCLIDGKIGADGATTMTVKYRLAKGASAEAVKKKMESSEVEVVKTDVDDQNWVTFELKMKDVLKLSTVPFFSSAAITRVAGEDGTETLKGVVTQKNPRKLPDEALEYYGKEMTVSFVLPGEVVKSNATETSGDKATWKMGLNDYYSKEQTVFEATYKKPAAKDG